MSTTIESEVARLLLQINAIKLSPQNPFTWASGLRAPVYCDNRLIASYPAGRRTVVDGFVQKAAAFQPFDVVAGIATGGIPYGAWLADRLDLPFIYVRSKAKEHGRQNLVEGELPAGARVLVIEDLVSTGGSSLAAVQGIRAAGGEVVGVLAIFTYALEQATEAFRNANCPIDTLTHYPALLEAALQANYIQEADVQTLQQWRDNPVQWSAKQVG